LLNSKVHFLAVLVLLDGCECREIYREEEKSWVWFNFHSALVDLLLLVHAQLAGAHVDQEDQAAAVIVISTERKPRPVGGELTQ
jgi:hypothetical protein